MNALSNADRSLAKCEMEVLSRFGDHRLHNQASGTEPTLFMQLAISKEGLIAGTFQNAATGQVQTLEGMADKKSQRVAWCVKGQERPIIETGISNLTQDTSPALIHFADGPTQQWLLVRLPDPQKG